MEVLTEVKVPVYDREKLKKATKVLNVINKRWAKQVIDLLNEKGPTCVGDITHRIRKDQSWTSQRLAKMEKVGLVSSEREGKYVYYSLNADRLVSITGSINRFFGKA